MGNKFKVSEGLRVQSTDVIDSSGNFVGQRLTPTSTQSSTSTQTGALVVPGGAGIGGGLFVGGVATATSFVGNLTGTATTATNIAGGTLGRIPYQSAPGATRFINTGVNGALLQMGAAGTATFVSNSQITVELSRYLVSLGGQGAIPFSGNNIGDPSIWLGLGSNGYILVSDTSGDGQPAWANPSTLTVGSATTATAAATAYALANTGTTYIGNAVTATNIRGGSAGSIPYQTTTGTTAFIGIGTNGYLLQSNGSSATWVSTSSIGVIGYTGSTGTQGIIGYTGSTGTQGIIGYTGSTGTQGIIGYTGSTGTQGIIGYTGSTGTQGIIGYTGSTGTQGIIGYTGSTGTQGVIGYTGSTGTQGVIGYTGSTGTQGVIGYTGSTGTQGIIGYTGSTGTQGVIGYTGSTGLIDNPYAGILTITNTTAVSSTVTGALQVAGGVGVGESIFIGGTATVLSTLASTTTLFGNALYVAGGVGIAKSLLVTGEAIFQNNVTFSGTTTFVFSTNTVYTDNILNLHTPSGGVGGSWAVNDGKDIGFVFHNYIDGADNDSFLGFVNNSKYLEWYVKGSESTSSIFTGTVYGIFKTGGIVLVNTTASNSTNTGALTVAGGAGIGGGLFVGGITTVTNTTNALSTITGALQVAGGMGVGRDLWVGAGVYAATKSFLIDHPSKSGWKLVHGSLEGPENGVYVRGKITGSNKIHLPDFWINLVDFDSITVNLTPIGKYQQLFVENVEGLEITIANARDSDMNFFYTVWAERIDVDKLRVEVN